MMDLPLLERKLAALPLYACFFIDPRELEFTHRVRAVCRSECPMYGKSWACPPGVGSVEVCRDTCLHYENCLVIATVAEVSDISDMAQALATRPAHEAITNEVGTLFQKPYILSTQACTLCPRCTYPDGLPCRMPERMHPCVESHAINLIPTLEKHGLEFQYGSNVVTWVSLLFFNG